MPTAATGPRLLFELRSLNSRQSSPAMTVPAEASTGSTVARHARRIAVQVDWVEPSSSR